nr:Stf0 family sulfotransferase [Parvularcula mediterranea]
MSGQALSSNIRDTDITNRSEKGFDVQPDKRYLIFFTPRSGSSWMTDVVTQTDVLGSPGEYFNPNFVASIAKTIRSNEPQDYVRRLMARKKTKNGVFGAEITFFQYRTVDGVDLFEAISPKCVFVLTRKNIIAQGISLYRAVTSGVFHDVKGRETPEPKGVPYDSIAIQNWINHIRDQEEGTDQLLRARGVSPIHLTYEALAGQAQKAIDAISVPVLGHSTEAKSVEENHRRLANKDGIDMEGRFREENGRFIEALEQRGRITR